LTNLPKYLWHDDEGDIRGTKANITDPYWTSHAGAVTAPCSDRPVPHRILTLGSSTAGSFLFAAY
jgi:hypothetical protein